MKSKILIRRNIKAADIFDAMKKIKKKYPYARMICYKFDLDYRITSYKDYQNRTISIAFIDNYKKLRKLL